MFIYDEYDGVVSSSNKSITSSPEKCVQEYLGVILHLYNSTFMFFLLFRT